MKLICEKKIYTKNYGGTVDLISGIDDFDSNIEFDNDTHTYFYNGMPIPSVTQLLDTGDYKYADEKALEYSRFKGTLVHKECQDWIESNFTKEGFTREFYKFKKLFYDNIDKFKEKAIWDYKTYKTNTKATRKKCFEQESMYQVGIKELSGEDIQQKYEIWLPPGDIEGKILDLTKEFEDGLIQ